MNGASSISRCCPAWRARANLAAARVIGMPVSQSAPRRVLAMAAPGAVSSQMSSITLRSPPRNRRGLRCAVRIGTGQAEPGRHDFSRVYLVCELRLSLLAAGREYPRAGGAGDRVAAAAAQDPGTPDRDRRTYYRSDEVHPVGRPVAADERRPERA